MATDTPEQSFEWHKANLRGGLLSIAAVTVNDRAAREK
jgi:hypothetical protein